MFVLLSELMRLREVLFVGVLLSFTTSVGGVKALHQTRLSIVFMVSGVSPAATVSPTLAPRPSGLLDRNNTVKGFS